MCLPAPGQFIGQGVFRFSSARGGRRDPGLDPKSESRDLRLGNKPMFRTRALFTNFHINKLEKKQAAKGSQLTATPGHERKKWEGNREIKIYVDLGWIWWRGWMDFKVNVWQFRWNTVSLSNRRWKWTGEDERIKRQAAGKKRELLRYLSLGTHERTLKFLKKKLKMNCSTHHTTCITAVSSSWLLKHHQHQELYSHRISLNPFIWTFFKTTVKIAM